MKKNFIGEKETKWTNKGNDMHEDADSLTQYNKSYAMFVQNFKTRGAVVPEKFLAEKKFTHIYTHRQTFLRKSQKLYTPPIYLV